MACFMTLAIWTQACMHGKRFLLEHLPSLLLVCGEGSILFPLSCSPPPTPPLSHFVTQAGFQLPVLFLGLQKCTTTPSLRGFLVLCDLHACVYPLGSIFPVFFFFFSWNFYFFRRPQQTLPGVFEIGLPSLLISKRGKKMSWNFFFSTISVSCC